MFGVEPVRQRFRPTGFVASLKSMRAQLVLGIDIGGTKTALRLEERRSGRVVWTAKEKTPPGITPRELLSWTLRQVEPVVDGHRLVAVGIAAPGRVDDRGVILEAKNLGWKSVRPRRLGRAIFRVPVAVEQDARAAARGESWRGSARRLRNFVFIALGTGVGAGLMVDGQLHLGSHFAAGELGDIPTNASEHRNGKKLSLVVGGRVIRARVRERVGEKLGSAEALRMASRDRRLRPLTDEVARHVAFSVAQVVHVLDPEAVIFGGGTSSAGRALLGRVRRLLNGWVDRPPRLLRSSLGEKAQLHGAIRIALDAFEEADR